MNANQTKSILAIAIIIFILIIIFGLIYKFTCSSGSSDSSGSSGSSGLVNTKYMKSQSLDKLYDEAGGNKALSDALMTTSINISTEKQSCSFAVTHKGVKGRKIECTSGCSTDSDDENSNFCKQFIYKHPIYNVGDDKDPGIFSDDLLDKTFVRRKASDDDDDDE